MMAKPPASKQPASRAGANNIPVAQPNRPSVPPTQSALQPRAHEQTHTVVTPKQPAPRHIAHKGPTTTNIGRRPSGPSPIVRPKVPKLVPTEPPTYGTANATRLVPNEVPLSLDRTSLGPTITSPFARRPTKQIPSALGGNHGEQPHQAPLTKAALVSPTQELTAMVSPSQKLTATMLSTPKLAAMALVHGNGPNPVTPLDFRTGN
ncbi:expressed unknown protein [Seminavis robusta]|uniref:Uncharacterized protein n=1 Tax=Seminavis robusta TaxID=568900 RepID=A0A9N8DD40_9STRA|nr:expressed unknown protein [Seminavis robusta]|eukprot:Sro91_g047921.1  (206) ;mRNA; r:122530-123147